MRKLAIVLGVAAITAAVANVALAERKIRSAQSSTVTTCMMTCNAQAANCQSTCLVPTATPARDDPNDLDAQPQQHRQHHMLADVYVSQITDYAGAWDCRVLHICAA